MTRARPGGLPGALALALGLTLAAGATTAAAAQRPEVVELRFADAASFTRAELASAIVTRATECLLVCWIPLGIERAELDRAAVEADAFRLRVYYYERGFREAQVTTAIAPVEPGEVRVTFRIHEGRPVRVAAVEVEGMPEGLTERSLPLRTGQPFDVVTYEATRDTLQRRLWNSGFARGQVLLGYTIRQESPYQATVRYDIYPGVRVSFADIAVEGTDEASPELVHRMLTFESGDPYDRSALLRSQRNLYGLQIFRHADVQADLEAGTDSVAPVTVRVAEGDMRRARLGGGANNVECGNVEGQWTSRNFLGNGRRLTVRGRVANLLIDRCAWLVDDEYATYEELTGLAAVDFTQPWLFGPRNSVGLGLFAERRNVPNVFVRSALGGYVSLSRSVGRGAALTLAYRPELTELITDGDLFFCVNFVACTFEALEDLREPHWLAPITLSFTIDRTNALFTPSDGFIARLDLEHARPYTGSDFAYTRLLGEGSKYLGEQGGAVLAVRFRGGVGIPHGNGASESLGLNPQKRFFGGGPNSVRGFDQYRLGPTLLGIDAVPFLVHDSAGPGCTATAVNTGACDASGLGDGGFDARPSGGEVLLEGNIEVRFPMPVAGGSLRGALFVDAGQVWSTTSDFAPRDIVATPGFGLRYHSPIGPIRLDVAFNTQGRRSLTVLTTRVESCDIGTEGCERVTHADGTRATVRNTDSVQPLDTPVSYGMGLGEINSVGDLLGRFRIHFSIGQAF